MPNIFTEMNKTQMNKEKGNQSYKNETELQDLSKQQQITALPYDVMSIIFDHVKKHNLMTYKKALPLVSKQWNRYTKLKSEQLQRVPVLKEVETVLARYLIQTEKNDKLRDMIPYRKQQRENTITRLLRMIEGDLKGSSLDDLLFKLHTIINNTDDQAQSEVVMKVFSILFNAYVDIDKLQESIIDTMANNNKLGASPDREDNLSYIERLLFSIFESDKAKVLNKMFVADCFLSGFENGNYDSRQSDRLDAIKIIINKLIEAHGNDPKYGEALRNQLPRYETVKTRYVLYHNPPCAVAAPF